jgi:hypothetical protein
MSRRALWPCSTVDPPNDVLPGRRRSRVDRSHYLISGSGGEAVSGLRLQLRLVGSYFFCSVWLTRSSLLPRPASPAKTSNVETVRPLVGRLWSETFGFLTLCRLCSVVNQSAPVSRGRDPRVAVRRDRLQRVRRGRTGGGEKAGRATNVLVSATDAGCSA